MTSFEKCADLAKYSGCRVASINYAPAPEKVWPAAVDDVVQAYLALRRQFPEAKLCLTGESGGGNLLLAATIRLLRTGGVIPECLVPHSPVCDFTLSLDRSHYEIRDNTVSEEGFVSLTQAYCPRADLADPKISPIYFDSFDKFPPTVITCDFNETLRADADALYKKDGDCGR